MKADAELGVMGGMFDPVHNGHLRGALEAREALGLDHVRLVPCGTPAHRGGPHADCGHRLAMLRLACRGQEGLEVDARECERAGTSYTFDTLSSLQAEFPRARLYLLLGSDAFNSLPTWYRWREIFGLAHVVVIARPGWEPETGGELGAEAGPRRVQTVAELRKAPAGHVLYLEQTPLEISSSQIRELISTGRPASFLLPQAVLDYIRDHHLYRGKGDAPHSLTGR